MRREKQITITDRNNRLVKPIYHLAMVKNQFHKKRLIRDMTSEHKTFKDAVGYYSRQVLSDGIRRNNNIAQIQERKPLYRKGLKVTPEIRQNIEYILNPLGYHIIW